MEGAVTEYRWQRTIALLQSGMTQSKVAEILGMSQSNVSRILKQWKENGEKTPKNNMDKRGRKPKLTEAQTAELKDIVSGPATEYGFENQVWTQRRVVQVIKEKFNIDFHPYSIRRVLALLGLSYKKPVVKDFRQDPEKVKEYREKTLPELKESSKKNMK